MSHTARGVSTRLYWLNASLLGAHEVDSAYWQEWALFRLPGGSDGFVAVHVVVFLAVLWGYEQRVRGTRAGRRFAWVLAGAGLFAVTAHGGFLLAGRPEFRSPISMILLAAIGIVSMVQAVVLTRQRA